MTANAPLDKPAIYLLRKYDYNVSIPFGLLFEPEAF